mmetsp:Transcript_6604/g.9662  ORF Transcript_6604/g.9662 Transcript_6604/m.9662 type:complete len:386 (-) Transcript_6604:23-1180(-)
MMNTNSPSLENHRNAYRVKAAQFLSLSSIQIHKKKSLEDCASKATNNAGVVEIVKNSTVVDVSKHLPLNPSQIAQSLMLRSMYDGEVANFEDKIDIGTISANCIVPFKAIASTENFNLNRSGANISSDAKKFKERNALEQQLQLLHSRISLSDYCNASTQIKSIKTLISNDITKSKLLNNNIVGHEFYCSGCGSTLLPCIPGEIKVKLRKTERSRTKRRRASRLTAKKFELDAIVLQKHRGGVRTFVNQGGSSHGSAVASVMITKEAIKKSNAVKRVHDGVSKNCIVYACHRCGHEECMKGLRPSKSSREKAFITVQSKSKLRKPTTDTRIAGANDDLDFLPLQRLVKPKADELKQTEQGKKQKKLKKKKPKSSGLNDFLSSLND